MNTARATTPSDPAARLFLAILLAVALLITALPFAGRVSAADPVQNLFFSEYVNGSANNKALEVYNAGGQAVELFDEYSVTVYSAAGAAQARLQLQGSLDPGEVWVGAHPLADAAVLAAANQTFDVAWFSGNHTVVLFWNGIPVDRIGQFGVDPGAGWGSGSSSTVDNTLRRRASVTTGDVNVLAPFDPSEQWVGVGLDEFGGLGCFGEGDCKTAPPPAGLTDGLRKLVADDADDGLLDAAAADGLLQRLDRADASLAAGDTEGAHGQLRAFAATLRGLVARGLLDPDAAQALGAAARDLIGELR